MTIQMINGFPVYAVTKKEVEYHPSYFQQQAEKWVEGAKKDKLSDEELENLKKKYNSSNMSKKDSIALLGDLVEAGIISKGRASAIYLGLIPLDESKINPTKTEGVLTKCDDVSDGKSNLLGMFGGLGTMLEVGGLDYYKNLYEYSKANTDVDVDNSQHFQDYRKFLEILEQLNGVQSTFRQREVSEQRAASEQASASSHGNYHGTLKMGYLHSEFSPVSGQELHMKYDESSTEDDPVMFVEGTDIQGNPFTRKIHLNAVDAKNATPAEMTALRVHLAQQGDKSVKSSSGIPLKALSGHQNVNSIMDFKQYYENWAFNLKNAGFKQNADVYMSELERYLSYYRTKGTAISDMDDSNDRNEARSRLA